MPDHHYYTLEEAISMLPNKPTLKWLIKQMTHPDCGKDNYSGAPPIPSFYAEDPLEVIVEGRKRHLTPIGWFDIYDLEGTRKITKAILIKGTNDGPYLRFSDKFDCRPCQPLRIPVDKLHIRHDELDHLLRSYSGLLVNRTVKEHLVQKQPAPQEKLPLPQLDRTGKTGPLATLIDNALQHYYIQTGKSSEKLNPLIQFLKAHMSEPWAKSIKKIGESEEKCLLLKKRRESKWYGRTYVDRIYKERKVLAKYPSQ